MTKVNKHERLKTVGVLVGILVFVSIVCMVISLISVASIRTTEPYRHSVDLALKSPKVREALGEPVTVGWLPQGAVNVSEGGRSPVVHLAPWHKRQRNDSRQCHKSRWHMEVLGYPCGHGSWRTH
jgi:hypothetical protein